VFAHIFVWKNDPFNNYSALYFFNTSRVSEDDLVFKKVSSPKTASSPTWRQSPVKLKKDFVRRNKMHRDHIYLPSKTVTPDISGER